MHELERNATRRLGLALLLLTACVSSREPNGIGGESHFLRRCEDQCGSGLDCIQGVCTRGCVVGKASCGDLAQDAVCTASSVEPGEVAVCDLGCSQDADCANLSSKHLCEAGYCRAPAVATVDAGSGGPSASSDKVYECPENVDSDPVTVLSSLIQADSLTLNVSFGGGCKEHAFSLCYGRSWNESYPVQTTLKLVHEDNDDECNSVGHKELRFDLTPMAAAYERMYRSKAGLISTNYGLYAFGELSCEERKLAADEQVTAYDRQVSRACQTSDDCVWTNIDTTCTSRCGTVASKSGAEELATWLATTRTAICRDYEADGCPPRIIPPCSPPGPLACVAGECKAE